MIWLSPNAQLGHIGLSCLFTKQHYVVDLPAGAVLGWVAFGFYQWLL